MKYTDGDSSIGYKSELLVKKDDNQKISGYVLTFAGTDVYSNNIPKIKDGANDMENFLGGSAAQYELAYQMAKKLVSFAENGAEVTFVGHSLGGGLAALASMATGCTAITFNPAVVADIWTDKLKMDNTYHGTSNIYGYVMEGDYITSAQNFFGFYMQGNFIKVANKTGDDPHGIDTMHKSLQ